MAEGQGDTLTMKYAQLLTMVEHCNYWEVKIANPWRTTQALHTYWVAKSTNTLSVPQGVTLIKRPLDRVVTFSTVHAGLLCMLHAEQKIVGMTDLNYVKHPLLLNAVKKGQITDMGSGLQPNIERIIEANAQALFVSTAHFIRAFKKETGLTPHQYLNRYRLVVATQLLEYSDRRVEEIAAEVGFSSSSHFISSFRRQYGCTPLHYREQLAGKKQ